jgi:hypothetical protein
MNAGHCLQRIACPQNQLRNPLVAISRLGPGPRRIPIALPRTSYWRQPSMLRRCLRNISSRANACRGSAYAWWLTSARTNAVCCEHSAPDDRGTKNPPRAQAHTPCRRVVGPRPSMGGEIHLRTKRSHWRRALRASGGRGPCRCRRTQDKAVCGGWEHAGRPAGGIQPAPGI